jgi:hypothetical protein
MLNILSVRAVQLPHPVLTFDHKLVLHVPVDAGGVGRDGGGLVGGGGGGLVGGGGGCGFGLLMVAH